MQTATVPRVITYHGERRETAIIVEQTARRIKLVLFGFGGISVKWVSADNEKYFSRLLYRQDDYPVSRAAKKFRQAGKSLGISKNAKHALKGL